YCLMPNHCHLHVKRNTDSISTVIHWLQTSHSVYFNKKYKHFSPVFTGRFKSILIQKEIYHRQLSKYIHLNPVKAGVVNTPQDYPYSSYGEIIGDPKNTVKIIDGRAMRSLLGNQTGAAVIQYRRFLEEDHLFEYSPN
ncbi:MAG: transposase, partial [Chitinophagaceae bacterium]|nr:transposase [Chitinophagaceae bacterium]